MVGALTTRERQESIGLLSKHRRRKKSRSVRQSYSRMMRDAVQAKILFRILDNLCSIDSRNLCDLPVNRY